MKPAAMRGSLGFFFLSFFLLLFIYVIENRSGHTPNPEPRLSMFNNSPGWFPPLHLSPPPRSAVCQVSGCRRLGLSCALSSSLSLLGAAGCDREAAGEQRRAPFLRSLSGLVLRRNDPERYIYIKEKKKKEGADWLRESSENLPAI